MFLQHPFPLTLFFLCSFQRRLWKMIWYKQGITFLSHCSFPICSVLTAQPIIKAITRIQFCLLHSTQQSQVLLLTEMEVERDEQQGRSFPDCISFSKARRGYGDNVSFHALLCIPLQWVGSDQHRSLCQAPGAGKKGEGHGTALLSMEPCTGNATTTCPTLGSSLAVNAAFEIF